MSLPAHMDELPLLYGLEGDREGTHDFRNTRDIGLSRVFSLG
jgi:hypothetical protein